MLNELPKQQTKKPMTRARYFWRIQGVCALRAVTPFMMYLFMSLLALACQAFSPETTEWYEVLLGAICIVCGAAFNAHLTFSVGKMHYDSYLTGCIHRKNAIFGIQSGGDHRPEQEYRPWKGFLIGFYVGIPVLILGLFAALPATWQGGEIALVMFAGWAIFPVQWIRAFLYPGGDWAYPPVSGGYAMLMIVLPVLVSGVFYIIGAMAEKRIKEEEAARSARVAEAAEKARKK